jgi:D-serine dehydratase
MKPIDFKERNTMVAENQEEYLTLPSYVDKGPKGEVIFCMQMTFKERVKLLFTGKLWCCLLCFGKPVTPSFFTVNKKDLFL